VDNGTMGISVDGETPVTDTFSPGALPAFNTATIGARIASSGVSQQLVGRIGHVAWWDGVALTAEQRADYIASKTQDPRAIVPPTHLYLLGDTDPRSGNADGATTIFDRGVGTAVNGTWVNGAAADILWDRQV
jgi:hypothetical protein